MGGRVGGSRVGGWVQLHSPAAKAQKKFGPIFWGDGRVQGEMGSVGSHPPPQFC